MHPATPVAHCIALHWSSIFHICDYWCDGTVYVGTESIATNIEDQIGVVCDRLNPIMSQIGETAQRQNMVAQELTTKVDKHENSMQTLNKRIKHVMQTEKNTDFICKIVLFLFLLTVIAVVVQMGRNN